MPAAAWPAAGALLAAACALPPAGALRPVSDGRYAMGTALEIELYARDPEEAVATLESLFAIAAELDALLTVYDPGSDVSRLNRSAGAGPQRVHPEVAEVLGLSREYARITNGSFDVTVGPLVELWTEAAARGRPPTREEIAAARRLVGSEQIRILPDQRAELPREGMAVNLGGIAKGYALDRMLPALEKQGTERALLSFGQSSTWAIGTPPGTPGWRLLVMGPADTPVGVVTLRDRALSVSGSLGQWVEIGGRRYGHVLDPRTGHPLERRRQALAVAPTAALAEALSKALLIGGEQEGVALVEAQPDCEGMLIDADGRLWTTSTFRENVPFDDLRQTRPP